MFFMMDFTLQAPLAPYGDAQRYDVQKLKTVLNHLGYYKPNKQTGIDDEMREPALFAALNAFQRDQGIEPYNHVFPRDETALALDKAARAIPKSQRYIWRTVGDGDANSMPSRRDGFAPAAGLQVERNDLFAPLIDPLSGRANPSVSPLDLIGGGGAIAGRTVLRQLLAARRDVSWIRNASRRQLQKKFKHAEHFDIKGNPNNQTLAQFKKALEDHVKSADTRVINGTYRGKPVTHFYNPRTQLNLMRNTDGSLKSAWRLDRAQIKNIEKRGRL